VPAPGATSQGAAKKRAAAVVSTCSQLTEAYINRGQMAEAAA